MKSLADPHRRPISLALALPLAVAALALLPAPASSQALPGLSSLRVTYNTRKATANPQGELKVQLDAVDKELTAAMRAATAPEALRAEIRYPGDFIRNVNRVRVGRGTFDVAAELAAAEAALAPANRGKDPFKGRTGSMERHYFLQGADEVMPILR